MIIHREVVQGNARVSSDSVGVLFCENSRYRLLHQRIHVVAKVSTMTITTTPDLCFMLWDMVAAPLFIILTVPPSFGLIVWTPLVVVVVVHRHQVSQ